MHDSTRIVPILPTSTQSSMLQRTPFRAGTFTLRCTASGTFTRIQMRRVSPCLISSVNHSPTVISAFNRRITHTLNIHKNALLGNQPWSFLGAYIWARAQGCTEIKNFDMWLKCDRQRPQNTEKPHLRIFGTVTGPVSEKSK
ncbi:hypothetical protein DFH08DRAFT_308206 [Mycena albidolilacea]|uniref:Uncharacterized protein n=1 Tax=Mycena albidolilacea TaxID=1033008 RepID=A0AAD6ZQ69_9AGAR|nr:hypothetical protein DFH08DRAFT_308206 [Mycena albidolilacea]